jgi:hypothetical protein
MDGFAKGSADGTGSDEFAVGYYLKRDLGFISHVADAYTLYDRYFHSVMASTYPNRHYQLAAQSGGQKGNDIPVGTLGNQWETILDRAKARGLSIGYYVSDLPFPACTGRAGSRGSARWRSSTRTPRSAGYRTFASSTPRSGTGRRRRDLGRRAPARRHPVGAGVHVRHRALVYRVAAVPSRRPVHQLRRVGRVLRARAAAPRSRRSREQGHQRGISGSPASDAPPSRSPRSPGAAGWPAPC